MIKLFYSSFLFVVFFSLFGLLRNAQAEIECREFFVRAVNSTRQEGPYLAEDFPAPPAWIERTEPYYSDWASMAARTVAVELKGGSRFEDVFGAVVAGRQLHAGEIEGLAGLGQLRESHDWSRPSVLVGHRFSPAGYPKEDDAERQNAFWQTVERRAEMISPYRNRAEMERDSSRSILATFVFETVRCETADGTRIASSTLVFDVAHMSISVIHPTTATSRVLLNDVYDRAGSLLAAPPYARTFVEFAAIAHSYFNAIPFQSGSATIGRPLLAGLHLAAFDRKIRLPTDIELKAITFARKDFIARLVAGQL